MTRVLLLLLIVSFCVAGQTASNSVTVTATRQIDQTPDQVNISISVATDLSATLDDAVAAVSKAGVTTGNFSQVSSYSNYDLGQGSLNWQFYLTVPLSELSATIAKLNALPNAGRGSSRATVQFSASGTQVSAAALAAREARVCILSDLLADARAQAAKLATSANTTVGPILGMTGLTPGTGFCQLTVKFALGSL